VANYTLDYSQRGQTLRYSVATEGHAIALPVLDNSSQSLAYVVAADDDGSYSVVIAPAGTTINGATSLILRRGQWVRIWAEVGNTKTWRALVASGGVANQSDVTQFGARGDGATDDTAAIQAAIDFSKANKIWQGERYDPDDTRPRGGASIYFPPGIYRIAGQINLTNINGLRFVGAGRQSSMLVHTASSGAMFSIDQMLFTSFEGLGFAAGTIAVNVNGALAIQGRTPGNRTTNCFNWTGSGGDGDRFNVWRECAVEGGFARVWNVGGSSGHSETTITSCHFFDCDYVWYSNNLQSMNTYFIACDAEFISESVFYYVAGGYLTVQGGSYINHKQTLTLAGTDSGIGTSNGHFVFDTVKWEMYQNIDASTAPKLLSSTSSAAAVVTFRNCSNMAGAPDSSETIISTTDGMRIVIDNCDFTGVMSLSHFFYSGFLTFRDCRTLPTVSRPIYNGQAWKVFYERCGGVVGPLLNRTDIADQNIVPITYPKNVLRLKDFASMSGAGTRTLTFAVPPGVIFTNAIITLSRSGGFSIDINAYMNAGKTVALFALNAGTFVTYQIFSPTINYSGGVAVGSYVSGSNIYIDVVAGGNIGVFELTISLEYIMHG
jgi:hypothetical protein